MHLTPMSQSERLTFTSRHSQRLHRKRLPGLLVTAFALLVVSASNAQAINGKVYPGDMCQELGSKSFMRYGEGGIHNDTTSARRVVCPLVRDTVKKKWKSLHVVVVDQHPTEDVTCRAYSAQRDGLGWFQTNSSSEAKPGVQTLTFGSQKVERDYGSYYLICRIPAAYYPKKFSGRISRILSYRINEQ